jgi:flagellar biosynthesis repressor protein FlbT
MRQVFCDKPLATENGGPAGPPFAFSWSVNHNPKRCRDLGVMENIMALKVELKPGERIILGDCVVTNADQRTRLVIEGEAPILREKDILTCERADTPAKRIYLAVQLMYTSQDPRNHHEAYFTLMRELVQAAPSAWPHMSAISNHILTGQMYKALKDAKKLIAYERELMDHAKRGQSLRQDRHTDGKPT